MSEINHNANQNISISSTVVASIPKPVLESFYYYLNNNKLQSTNTHEFLIFFTNIDKSYKTSLIDLLAKEIKSSTNFYVYLVKTISEVFINSKNYNFELLETAIEISKSILSNEFIKPLLELLNSDYDKIHPLAISALIKYKPSDEIINALTNHILHSKNETIVSGSLKYLTNYSELLIKSLIKKLDQVVNARRKALIIKFIANSNFALLGFDVFKYNLAKFPNDFGIFCIAGLAKIGTLDAIEELKKHLNNSEWFIRKKIVEALGLINKKEVIPVLLETLNDQSVQVRSASIESLVKVGRLQPSFILEYYQKASNLQKIGILKVVSQLKSAELLPILKDAIQDRALLFFTLEAMGELGCVECTNLLVPFLNDNEWFNRLNALEALQKLNPPNLKQLAQTCLNDENDMVRNLAHKIVKNL